MPPHQEADGRQSTNAPCRSPCAFDENRTPWDINGHIMPRSDAAAKKTLAIAKQFQFPSRPAQIAYKAVRFRLEAAYHTRRGLAWAVCRVLPMARDINDALMW